MPEDASENNSSQKWGKWVFFPVPVERFICTTVILLCRKHTYKPVCVCDDPPYQSFPLLCVSLGKEVTIQPNPPGNCYIRWRCRCLSYISRLYALSSWKLNIAEKTTTSKSISEGPQSFWEEGKLISHITSTSDMTERQAVGHLPLACQHGLKDSLTPPASCSDPLIRTHLHFRHKSLWLLHCVKQSLGA